MNRETIDQKCYKILLSIGESLDLKKMLGRSLGTYIGELDCSMGAVLLAKGKGSSTFSLHNAFSIPRNIEGQPSFAALRQELLHHDFSDDIITHSIAGSSGIYYVMGISDIGLLVLYKEGEAIVGNLLTALKPINHKLGTASKACLQNTGLEKISKQFMEMANMLPGLIIELDNAYKVSFFNRRTQEIFKQIDSDEFRPKSIFDFFPPSLHPKVLALLHRCEMGETMVSGDFLMQNSRNVSFMVNLSISPIKTDSSIVGYRGIAIDITSRVQLEKDLKLRDRLFSAITLATQELLKSQDYDLALPAALTMIARAIEANWVNYFKNIYEQDGCLIKSTRLMQLNLHGEVASEDRFELYAEDIPLILESLENKRYYQAITGSMESGMFKEHLLDGGILAFITIPIIIKEKFWGFLAFSDSKEERVWSAIECDLLQLFAISISESLNRRQVEDELSSIYQEVMDDLETARTVQSYMLPPWVQIDDQMMFSTNYRPWATIGGDFFDCIRLSEKQYVLYIADISGHGIQAALTMTAVKSIINLVVRSDQEKGTPAGMITSLNATLIKRLFKDNYMTMCYCVLDFEAMTLSCINAGHPPLFLRNMSTGRIRVLDSEGNIPLGWKENHVYPEESTMTVPFTQDEAVCMITDGVFECFNDRQQELGQEHLLTMLQQIPPMHSCIMLPHLCYDEINAKGYTKRYDDFSFIALQALPASKREQSFYSVLASHLANADTTAIEVEQFVIANGRSEMEGFKTRLVTSEFLSNVIEHGLHKSTTEKIALEVQITDHIEVIIRDSADQWDFPEKEPVMADFFDLLNEDALCRGRGLQIIYAMTESFTRRRVHEVNETRFVISSE
ncbi:MAG: SpoIIE family protein phosphatase [Sphaerochaeta sp.]|nr:SpoIIE family protein phosphatase [Sphaerochaeta sp.]